MEDSKQARQQKKRLFTRQVNAVQRFLAEESTSEELKNKREDLKKAFHEFKAAHEQYESYLEQETDFEECDKYFQEVQETYVKALKEMNSQINQLDGDNQSEAGSSSAQSDVKPTIVPQQASLEGLMNLPRVEIEAFSGDPMKYHAFIAVFEQSVEKLCEDGSARLTRLLQYTEGKAKKAIRACSIIGGQDGYDRAREILKQRFGDRHMIAESMTNKLRSGKSVYKKEDIQELADDLTTCVITLEEMDRLHEIDTQKTIVDLINRLPRYIQHRWQKKAIEIKRGTGTYPGIKELHSYICDIAEEVNDPVYGKREESVKKSQLPKEKRSTSSPRAFSADTTVYSSQKEPRKTQYVHICPLCNENHRLLYCSQFKCMKPVDRLQFVKGKDLCENCLLNNHGTGECRKPGRCTVCNQKHTKFIHVDVSNANNVRLQSLESNEVSSDVSHASEIVQNASYDVVNVSLETNVSDQILLPVIPVTVNNSRSALALLDNASTNSFCSEKFAKSLGLKGKEIDIQLSTLEKCHSQRKTEVVSFTVSNNGETLSMSNVYITDCIPVPSVDMKRSYKHLSGIPLPRLQTNSADILIGQDFSEALIPLEVIQGDKGEPYAVRTLLGWTVCGPYEMSRSRSNQVAVHNITLDKQVEKMWTLENELLCDDKAMSVDDRSVIELWESKGRLHNGHYELPLPWVRKIEDERRPDLRNNRIQAVTRFNALRKRLTSNKDLCDNYKKGIQALLSKGYAEAVPAQDLERNDGGVYYLPHHPIYNIHKKKIRIVFDCSAKYHGSSLNDHILQGPDLTNKLTSVLLRFRENGIAVVGDVEAMYHQVKVPVRDRDALRFIWSKNNELDGELVDYRMTVHLFGGVWSSSAANYSLRRTADENETEETRDAAKSIRSNFYVDDWLFSTDTVEKAIQIQREVSNLLKKGGFKLTKFNSTKREVLKSLPPDDRSPTLLNMDLDKHELPQERALGISWNIETDSFYFKINHMEKPHTRRGVISIISSIFDPLGFVSPVIVQGKMIFRELTKLGLSWDDAMPQQLEQRWYQWLNSLPDLENMQIPRCVQSLPQKGQVIAQLHHFTDSSQLAYGVVTYLRLIDHTGQIHVSLLVSKSKLAPVKAMTIPRLELTAAVLAAKMDDKLKKQMEMSIDESFFWCDSLLVIQYIQNEKQRFHMFVANRVAIIQEASRPHQWRHVPGKQNPADSLTRGLGSRDLINSNWLSGPEFLSTPENEWQLLAITEDLPSNDPEIKGKQITCVTEAMKTFIDDLILRASSFHKLKRRVAWLLKFKEYLILKALKKQQQQKPEITLDVLKQAEQEIITHVQRANFPEEYETLRDGKKTVKRSSSLYKLSPILRNNIICVGGRLSNSNIPISAKHQIIIPKKHELGKIIIRDAHEYGHTGTEHVLAKIRERFWIIRARPMIRQIISKCFDCKRRLATPATQMMNDLPPDRVQDNEPPFSCTGTDCFGPLYVKKGRASVKRYGCLFTCLNVRAIHIEVLQSLDASSFINAFQRFISRRGKPRLMRSDNGTNYRGAEKELRKSLNKISTTRDIMLKNDTKWIFNTPAASHHGGVWERQLRSIRKILLAVAGGEMFTMDDEQLSTFLCIVESIINSRPITKNPDDASEPEALTPNHLLLLREGPAPLGKFEGHDLYGRKWRQVQWLASVFWKRWIKEYLPNQQIRNKNAHLQENLQVDDLVLLMDEQSPRSMWPLARIVEVIKGRDGLVRSVKLKSKQRVLTRPITKIVLLERMS